MIVERTMGMRILITHYDLSRLKFAKVVRLCAREGGRLGRSGEQRMLSYFVRFEFTAEALFEIDRFWRKEGREIKTLTVREILDEEISGKPE